MKYYLNLVGYLQFLFASSCHTHTHTHHAPLLSISISFFSLNRSLLMRKCAVYRLQTIAVESFSQKLCRMFWKFCFFLPMLRLLVPSSPSSSSFSSVHTVCWLCSWRWHRTLIKRKTSTTMAQRQRQHTAHKVQKEFMLNVRARSRR